MLDYKSIITRHYTLGLCQREVAKQFGASVSGFNDFIHPFEKCDAVGYPLPKGIAELVYGPGYNRFGRNEMRTMRRFMSIASVLHCKVSALKCISVR